MHLLEADLEKAVVAWATAHKVLFFKLNLRGNVGWPDRLFVFPNGMHVYLELKRKGERPEPLQDHRLATLNRRKVHAYWSDNYYDCIRILEAALVSDGGNATHDFASLRGIAAGSGVR